MQQTAHDESLKDICLARVLICSIEKKKEKMKKKKEKEKKKKKKTKKKKTKKSWL